MQLDSSLSLRQRPRQRAGNEPPFFQVKPAGGRELFRDSPENCAPGSPAALQKSRIRSARRRSTTERVMPISIDIWSRAAIRS